MISFAIFALAAIGLAISSYFTGIAYRWIDPATRWVPKMCRLSEGTCAQIVFTPRARLFGMPNSVLGQLYYGALMIGIATGSIWRTPVEWLTLIASLATVVIGAYLTWSLLFRTRVNCVLCFTSHAINLAILLLLLSRLQR